MTPPESQILQDLGLNFLLTFEDVAIHLSFYGASSSLVVAYYVTHPTLMTGVFCVLFSISVVIFVFVSCKRAYSLTRPD